MNPAKSKSAGIAIFAKAPVAGFAKTRLIPLLGAQGAANLQHLLIGMTTKLAFESLLRPISFWCAPDRSHESFFSIRNSYGVDTYDQAGEDLGARMLQAFELLTPGGPLLLIGTDCPAMTTDYLTRCARALDDGADAAFVPAEDGGYALIGLRRPIPQLFDNIAWGTGSVMATTRKRLQALNLRHFETEAIWDIDTPADYQRALAAGMLDHD